MANFVTGIVIRGEEKAGANIAVVPGATALGNVGGAGAFVIINRGASGDTYYPSSLYVDSLVNLARQVFIQNDAYKDIPTTGFRCVGMNFQDTYTDVTYFDQAASGDYDTAFGAYDVIVALEEVAGQDVTGNMIWDTTLERARDAMREERYGYGIS